MVECNFHRYVGPFQTFMWRLHACTDIPVPPGGIILRFHPLISCTEIQTDPALERGTHALAVHISTVREALGRDINSFGCPAGA